MATHEILWSDFSIHWYSKHLNFTTWFSIYLYVSNTQKFLDFLYAYTYAQCSRENHAINDSGSTKFLKSNNKISIKITWKQVCMVWRRERSESREELFHPSGPSGDTGLGPGAGHTWDHGRSWLLACADGLTELSH